MAEVAWGYFSGISIQLPGLTRLVLHPDVWLLFVPIPWVIYSAVLSNRKELSVQAVFIFAGTLVFAMTSVFCVVAVAGLLPLLPMKIGH